MGQATRYGFLLALLCTASFAAMGPLTKGTANPRYFAEGNGKAVYLSGSHVWYNMQDSGSTNPPPAYDYASYLNLMSSRHHNFIRLWALENPRWAPTNSNFNGPMAYARSTVCCEADGGNKFDLNTFNQSYFDRLRSRVMQAQSKGIYVSVMLFNGWNIETKGFSGNPWLSHPYRGGNNIQNFNADTNGDNLGIEVASQVGTAANNYQKAYVRKVIDTLSDLDNVLWEITNEAGAYSTAWQYDMINYIKSYEAGKAMRHPVGMTYQWPDGNNAALFSSPADWISPNPSAASPYSYMYNPPPADGGKVIINDTDHLWGVGGGHDWVWMTFTRGMNPIFMDDGIVTFPATTGFENVRQNMGATVDYSRRMNLTAMPPRGDLTTTGFALANPGSEYLVYQKAGGAFSATLVAGTYVAEWYNPNTNIITSGGTITAVSGSRSFTPPFSGDAVLYLKSTTATTTTTTTTSPTPTPTSTTSCAAPATGAFTGCYFSDITMSRLALTRTDPTVNFSWYAGSPDASLPANSFSARWEGLFTFNAANYTFTVTADDGVRLFVDNQLVIDRWVLQTATTYTVTKAMAAGTHNVRMEYFEDTGYATAKLSWVAAPTSGTTTTTSLTRYLSDLTWLRATNGWGPVEKDRSNNEQPAGDGRVITIRGATFAKGLGVHAASDITYGLGAQCTAFQADIGLDDEIAPNGSVVFQVFKDGVKAFDSGRLTAGSPRQTINVNITGANNLQLVVTNGGDNINSDHADWAGARVLCSSTAILK
jgi:hypothetical protein